jgi:phage-related protein (TIGR01555 family)
MQVIHESRLVLFGGAKTAPRERQQLNGWDYSVLQRPHEILGEFNLSWKAVQVMLTDGNQGVFTMAGLAEAIESGSMEALKRRLEIIDLYRSNLRSMVVDAGDGVNSPAEKFERLSPSLEQLPQVLQQVCLRLASTVHMPATILMGQSPAGMNATGESDFRWWYDRLRSMQVQKLAPRIRRIVFVLLAAKDSPLRGRQPQKVEVGFPDLWRETPKERSERRAAIASGDAAYINAGVYLPQEVALTRSSEGGLDREIVLTPEAKKAREDALKDDLAGVEGDVPPTKQGSPDEPQDSPPPEEKGDPDSPAPKAGAEPDDDEE